MNDTEKIYKAVYRAIDEHNEVRETAAQLEKAPSTVLFGSSGALDSIALVNLVVTIEEIVHEEFGTSIILADEKAMSQKTSPFKTIGSLVHYIASLLDEKNSG